MCTARFGLLRNAYVLTMHKVARQSPAASLRRGDGLSFDGDLNLFCSGDYVAYSLVALVILMYEDCGS